MKRDNRNMSVPIVVIGALVVVSMTLLGLQLRNVYSRNFATSPPRGQTPLLPGLTAQPLSQRSTGLVVTSVRFDSEAQREGVAVGDDILSVNNLPATVGRSRSDYVSNVKDGSLRLELRHANALRTIVLHPTTR